MNISEISTHKYRRAELDSVQKTKHGKYMLQVKGCNGSSTKWLSINQDELAAIKGIIANPGTVKLTVMVGYQAADQYRDYTCVVEVDNHPDQEVLVAQAFEAAREEARCSWGWDLEEADEITLMSVIEGEPKILW